MIFEKIGVFEWFQTRQFYKNVMKGINTKMKIMSFNVLTSEKKTAEIYNRVLFREERLASAFAMLLELHPDVIGLQEVSDVHRESFKTELIDYDMVGSPAKPVLHEQGVYVMYDKTKYDLVRWGIKWLSEKTDEEHSYVREAAEENANRLEISKGIMHQPRKAVYVILNDKQTGRTFGFCDTHLGHTPVGSDGEVSKLIRQKQAKILVDLIEAGEIFDIGMPFIVVGDMNSQPYMLPYQEYMRIADDARECAVIKPDKMQNTLHGYRMEKRYNQIDYIFLSKDNFLCSKFEIITKEYYSDVLKMKILPSDHYALMADVTLLPEEV